jgi:hypothetical protein
MAREIIRLSENCLWPNRKQSVEDAFTIFTKVHRLRENLINGLSFKERRTCVIFNVGSAPIPRKKSKRRVKSSQVTNYQ